MANELGALPEAVRNLVLHPPLETVPVLRWDAVPVLGSPIMQVVDAVQVHVLRVPADSCTHCNPAIRDSTRIVLNWSLINLAYPGNTSAIVSRANLSVNAMII